MQMQENANLPAISCYDKYKNNKNKTKQMEHSGEWVSKPQRAAETIASFRQRNNTFTNHHLRLAATLHPYH
jgi:hypothetical protein